MSLRSVFDIDVNDEAFQEYLRTFEKYQDALAKIPGAWGRVNQATGEARSEFADIAASLMAMLESMTKINRETDSFERHARGASRFLSGMAREARDISNFLGDATRSILRWTGVTSAAAGLLGFGSVWGLDEIGAWAGNLRRSSSGLGFTPGNAALMQAFQTNLGRIIDPGTFLGGVNTALHDVSQRWTLNAAGLSGAQLRGDTGQVGMALLQRIWGSIHNAPSDQIAQIMQARGYDRFMSLQDAVRLRQTPYNELQDLLGQTRYDARGNSVKISDDDLKRWQDFQNALQRAGNTLWDAIVNDLTPLAKPLTELSLGFTKAADAFLQSDALKGWISDATEGLKRFAIYVSTPQFQKDVQEFTGRVHVLGDQIEKIVVGLGNFVSFMSQHSDLFGDIAVVGGAYYGARVGGAVGGPIGAAIGGTVGAYAGAVASNPVHRSVWSYIPFTTDWFRELPGALGLGPKGVTGGVDVPSAWPGAPSQGRVAAPNDASFNWGSLRARGGGFQHFSDTGAGVDAVRDNLLKYYQGLTLGNIISKWAPASDHNQTNLLIQRATRIMGLGADVVPNFGDSQTMRRLVTTMIANEHGGVLPPGLSQSNIDQALGITGMKTGSIATDAARWVGTTSTNPSLRQFVEKGANLDPAQAAWCAAFANAVLASEGIKGSGSNVATSFLKWGQGVNPTAAQAGDVMVNARGLPAGAIGGHVGFFTGVTKDGRFQMVSGNHEHAVGYSWVDPNGVAIRHAVGNTSAYSNPPVAASQDAAAGASGTTKTNGFTSRFVSKQAPAHVTIDVHNATGGNATVGAAQVATP